MTNQAIQLTLNNNNVIIDGSLNKEIYYLLKKELGYTPESSIYMIKNKESLKNWDGTISTVCYSKSKCKCPIKSDGTHFPTGLTSRAIKFLKGLNVPYNIIDKRPNYEKNFELELSEQFELRDYQVDTVQKAISAQRGIIKIATGGGKTGTAASIIKELAVSPFIFYVTSNDLLYQAHDEFTKFLRQNGSNLKVGIIGNGKCDIQDLTVMTVQTAIRACGEKYQKFDEEDNKKEDKSLDERRKDILDLIRSSKGFMNDECQHVASKTCQVIAGNSLSAKYRYGLSIFPKSKVELRGWNFGKGTTCTIEDMWNTIIQSGIFEIKEDNGYEIIKLNNIESRSWSGSDFYWKPVKHIIRHKNNKKCYSVKFSGEESITMTEDHSLFKIEDNVLKETKPNDLSINDILLMDNGNDFSSTNCLDNIDNICNGVSYISKDSDIYRKIVSSIAYVCGLYFCGGEILGDKLKLTLKDKVLGNVIYKAQDLIFKNIGISPDLESHTIKLEIETIFNNYIKYYFGNHIDNNIIPDAFLFSCREIREEFLNGIIDSNLNKVDDEQFDILCKSEEAKDSICLLLRSLNISYSVAKDENIKISFHKDDVIEQKKRKYIEQRVLSVEEVYNYSDYVYDLEMDGHPSFVANGILVHNSATPYRDLNDDILIEACFGRTIVDINASFLIKNGYLVKPYIKFAEIKSSSKRIDGHTYPAIYDQAIVHNDYRNEWIVKAAERLKNEGRTVLILVRKIEHGYILNDMISDSIFLHGDSSKNERLEHIEKIRVKEAAITIASSIFDEGIDCRPLDSLILAGAGKSKTRALQRVGRTLRPYKDKKYAIVLDFLDRFKHVESHSNERRNIYAGEEEFDIKNITGV